jgi:hypothetical protein
MVTSTCAVGSVALSSESGEESVAQAADINSHGSGNHSHEDPSRKMFHRGTLIALIMLFIGGTVSMVMGVMLHQKEQASKPELANGGIAVALENTSHPSLSPSFNPSAVPSIAPSSQFEVEINDFLKQALNLTEDAPIFTPGTDQWNARRWIANDDPISLNPLHEDDKSKLIQRFALMTIFYSMSGNTPMEVDWMGMDECYSAMTSCDDNGIIRALQIGKKM